jgi:hypothetical protein
MLSPSPLKRYNHDPVHPYFVPELQEQIDNGDIVVTVDNFPVKNCIGFDVANGYAKRLAHKDDLQRFARLGENAYARVCRDGVRIKGVVRVFVNSD